MRNLLDAGGDCNAEIGRCEDVRRDLQAAGLRTLDDFGHEERVDAHVPLDRIVAALLIHVRAVHVDLHEVRLASEKVGPAPIDVGRAFDLHHKGGVETIAHERGEWTCGGAALDHLDGMPTRRGPCLIGADEVNGGGLVQLRVDYPPNDRGAALILEVEDAGTELHGDGLIDARIDQMLMRVGKGRDNVTAGQIYHRIDAYRCTSMKHSARNIHGLRHELRPIEPSATTIGDTVVRWRGRLVSGLLCGGAA